MNTGPAAAADRAGARGAARPARARAGDGVAPRRSPSLSVAIVDDHAVVRKGYRRFLELAGDIRVAAEFGDANAAYHWLGGHAVDVLILDLSMPGRSGLDVLLRLMQRGDAPQVLVFTMHESAALASQALSLGACGYVTKSSAPELLVEAVRKVARGERTVSVDFEPRVQAANDGGPEFLPHRLLSAREFEIFLLLAQGASVEGIAQAHSLSFKTVSNYQTTIRQKTGLSSALEMYRYALEHGLIAWPLARI